MTHIEHHTTTVDGLATGYLEAGSGDPVILLHGGEFGASAEIGWERTIPALAAHYRVIAPDMVGFGFSDRPAGQRYGMDEWVAQAVGVLPPEGADAGVRAGHAEAGADVSEV